MMYDMSPLIIIFMSLCRLALSVTANITQPGWTASVVLTSTMICPGDPRQRETLKPANVRPSTHVSHLYELYLFARHFHLKSWGCSRLSFFAIGWFRSDVSARSDQALCIILTNAFVPSSGCECNNHAERCHFDQTVYESSGRKSGGVCDGCMHHTTGPKCDQCAPGYQPNPRSRMNRPDACIRKWMKVQT